MRIAVSSGAAIPSSDRCCFALTPSLHVSLFSYQCSGFRSSQAFRFGSMATMCARQRGLRAARQALPQSLRVAGRFTLRSSAFIEVSTWFSREPSR